MLTQHLANGGIHMADTGIHVFRVLLGPKLYRDIEIASAKTLYDLAAAIVRTFDFDFDHAFGFFSKLTGNIFASPVKYELFADMGEGEGDARSVKKTRIAEAFPATGAKMIFLFDYGDEWRFRVELIGQNQKKAGVKYPRQIKAAGKAPEQYPDLDEE
jgi:hypothetical protein